MADRTATLTRIFDAAGLSARMTPDERRELVAHLEDSMNSKVDDGASELEALGAAFEATGDLRRVADRMPRGSRLAAWSRGAAWKGLALVGLFGFIQTFLTPKFNQLFQETGVRVPPLMRFYSHDSQSLGDFALILAISMIGVAAAIALGRRRGWTEQTLTRLRATSLSLYGAAALLSLGLVAGGVPAVISLFQGLGL